MSTESISQTATTLQTFLPAQLTLESVLWALLMLVMCVVVIKLIMRFAKTHIEKLPLEKTLVRFMLSAVRFMLYFITALIVADRLGIPVSSLVALLGVAGLAFSLAIQDSLTNLFSGFTLLVSKPFKVGDYVETGTTGGTVDNIGLMYTRLITPDNKVVLIPNKDTAADKLTNYSTLSLRRVEIKVGVSYTAAPEHVKAALLSAAANVPHINEPAPFAGMLSFDQSAITYVLRIWVECGMYWDVYFALMEKVKATLDEQGISIPYNRLDVRLTQTAERNGD